MIIFYLTEFKDTLSRMDSFTPYIFIGLAIAMAVGPIMLLRPSKSQQVLSQLRSSAAARGLIVQSVGTGREMNYYRPWKKRDQFHEEWSLIRVPYEHGAHFYKDWDWQQASTSLNPNQRDAITQILQDLERFGGVGVNRIGIYLTWNESLKGLGIEANLEKIDQYLSRIEAAL